LRRAGLPGPAAYQTAGFLPAGPVAALVFRAERAILARRLREQPASCRLGRCEQHRPTGVPRRGSPRRLSRRGWRAEGHEARERESSSEPRPGWPRRTAGETARAPPELVFHAERAIRARRLARQPASCRLGRLQRWSFAPSGPSGPGGLGSSRRRAGWAGAGRTGLLGPHRPTGGPRRGSPRRSSRRGWRAEGHEARERESSSEPRPGWPRRTSGETARAPPELVFRAERAIRARRLREQPASCRLGRCEPHRPTGAAPAYWGSAKGEPTPLEPAWLASGGPRGPRARKLE